MSKCWAHLSPAGFVCVSVKECLCVSGCVQSVHVYMHVCVCVCRCPPSRCIIGSLGSRHGGFLVPLLSVLGLSALATLPSPSIHSSILILTLIDTSSIPDLQVWEEILYDIVCLCCFLCRGFMMFCVCGCQGKEGKAVCMRGSM